MFFPVLDTHLQTRHPARNPSLLLDVFFLHPNLISLLYLNPCTLMI
jgi:hypothetical protein